MIVALHDAVASDSGGKAATLGRLLRAGLPVPDGFVISFAHYRADSGAIPAGLRSEIADGLAKLGEDPVAVRSSASSEDTATWSGAGQYDSVLGVRGIDDVLAAVSSCWASTYAARAVGYRTATGRDPKHPLMAVIVQRFVAADVSGVMFTPAGREDPTVIEASFGLGPSVVGGTVMPDSFRVVANGSIARAVADKRTRIDSSGDRLVTRAVAASARTQPSLNDADLTRLAAMGAQIADLLGAPQDVEWAIADGHVQILQARPITAALPPTGGSWASALQGMPGSAGSATGIARVVRGPQDFGRVRRGDILVCKFTDPAWTPLLQVVAGAVTETGGVLSHAAIIARELHIPAVLGFADATTVIRDGSTITINGTTGTITTA